MYEVGLHYTIGEKTAQIRLLIDETKTNISATKQERKVLRAEQTMYPHVLFHFTVRRRTTYYLFNLCLPFTLIMLMNITGYLLPLESGEKVSLREF